MSSVIKASRVEFTTYPSGLKVKYDYDQVGNLRKIIDANNTSNVIWEALINNELDAWTSVKYGNGLITNFEYNGTTNMLQSIKVGTSGSPGNRLNLGFTFNSKGQLNQRTESRNLGATRTENFGYDSFNRLTSSTVTGQQPFNVVYASNGNINSTSIGGSYTYSNYKVTEVSWDGTAGGPGQSPAFSTSSTFTPDNRIATMDNGTYRNEFTYSPSGQRFAVDHYQGTTKQWTKLYAGPTEIILDAAGNITKWYTHIQAPTGICAVYEKVGTTTNFHYIHTDYLGSWLAVSNQSGSLTHHHSYDAWGRPRDPFTWQLKPVDIANALLSLSNMQPIFDRGYTGHEHMAGFGLINMNGRLYDPYLQRFLSPDPYVQEPGNAQNYNRYAYCLNNPLMYTDPSGEILNLAFFSFVFFCESIVNLLDGKPNPFVNAYNFAKDAVNFISNMNKFAIFSNGNTTFYGNFNPFNLLFPSVGFVKTAGNFTFSGEFGYNPFGGGWYSSGSVNYTNGKFSATLGGGYGSNYWSVGGSATYNGYGGGYYYTRYGNAIGPDGRPNSQSVGGAQLFWKGGSFRLENDFLAGKINGDTKDRWRTNSLEFAFGDFVIGSSVYTNEVNEEIGKENKRSKIWGFNNNNMGSWKDGEVFSSPLWIGLRTGNMVGRIGYSHHIFQDFFQNGVHKFLVPTPYFTGYDNFQYNPYFYSGFYNPFSLW